MTFSGKIFPSKVPEFVHVLNLVEKLPSMPEVFLLASGKGRLRDLPPLNSLNEKKYSPVSFFA